MLQPGLGPVPIPQNAWLTFFTTSPFYASVCCLTWIPEGYNLRCQPWYALHLDYLRTGRLTILAGSWLVLEVYCRTYPGTSSGLQELSHGCCPLSG